MKQYIGQEPKKPIYVKTVHRVGCRFTAHRSAIVMIKPCRNASQFETYYRTPANPADCLFSDRRQGNFFLFC